jgi:hypothetical protein
MGALKLSVHIGLDEIRADEFCAMLIIADERDLLEPDVAQRGQVTRARMTRIMKLLNLSPDI